MRTKIKITMAIMLIAAIAALSGCASKEAEKNPVPAVQTENVDVLSSDVAGDISSASEIADDSLQEVNFTLVDENLI